MGEEKDKKTKRRQKEERNQKEKNSLKGTKQPGSNELEKYAFIWVCMYV